MKIALILDQYDNHDNGTTISAARFAERLRARGHEVRVVSTGKPAPGKFVVPSADFGILNPIFGAHGMTFGRPDPTVIRQALDGVDIAHMYLPFKLCMKTRRIAKQMDVPHMAAFHCQPENISYNIGMKHVAILPLLLYHWFHRRFYRYIGDIHCPSQFIADQLKKHGYKAKLHVISNGVDEAFRPISTLKPPEWRDKFVIMMVGRLSAEKRQDLIVKAALASKYSDRIQLVFLGKGPRQKYYERLGARLKNKPIFKYVTKEELLCLYNQADLYVHAAEAEIEALVCIEAISCGLVPVIANAKMSAAKQFAIDERSLFKNKCAADLTGKIEYWMDHPKEKAAMARRYREKAGQYSLDKSIDQIEAVYGRVIRAQRKPAPDPLNAHVMHMPTPFVYKVDEHFHFINRNIFFRLGSAMLFYLIGVPFLSLVARIFFGLRITGKKNLQYLKGGAITVTNHIHILDSPMVACTLFPRKPFFAALKSNFEIPFVRWLVRLLGGVPIPESPKALHAFMETMRKQLEKGRIVHFYPEASLWPRYDMLRPFKNGAFHLAVKSNVPVIPMVFTFRDPGWLMAKLHKKPLITLQIGTPEYPATQGSERHRILEIRRAVKYSMENMLSGSKKSAS